MNDYVLKLMSLQQAYVIIHLHPIPVVSSYYILTCPKDVPYFNLYLVASFDELSLQMIVT